MNKNYLMIKTQDKREFLAPQDLLNDLKEFAKLFKAEIYLVSSAENNPKLNLNKLIAALCNPDFQSSIACQIKKKLFPEPKQKA